jgi:hypothetical protein
MNTRYKRRIDLALAALALLALSAPATAQISSEVQSALRSNCRSDAMSKCSGMRGQDALACLQKNVNSLSPACKAAVSKTLPKPHSEAPAAAPAAAPPAAPAQAAAPPPAPAPAATPAPAQAVATPAPPAAPAVAAPPPPAHPKTTASKPPAKPAAKPVAAAKPPVAATPTAAQQSAMRSACRSDFMSHCSGVSPGGKEALACLQRNVAALSPGCKSVVSSTMAAPAAATAAAPPPAAPVQAGGGPTPEQLSSLKFTCRRDFSRHCKGVPPGPEAFACLQVNQAKLSPNCRTSVAAIAADMPEGGAATVPATTMASPPPKVGKPSVANAVVMLRACKLDLVRHCRGVEPGGGRELACLAAHEDNLSVRCKMARRVTAPLR